MQILCFSGREDIAVVYIGKFKEERLVEFAESLEPPYPIEKKWVLTISTMFGCVIKCLMCDAGSFYRGKLSKGEILSQIDFLVNKRFRGEKIPVEKFKIQFSRLGEPSLNSAVLDVLAELPYLYKANGLIPSISTIAPYGTNRFFDTLFEIKESFFKGGKFQLQFSIHTTDEKLRNLLVPVKKWSFEEIANYGEKFYKKGDRKITLNFAMAKGMPVESDVLLKFFDPKKFLIKITPLNPTYKSLENGLISYIDPYKKDKYEVIDTLRSSGYEVIVSIGEPEENMIGSNCGQNLIKHLREKKEIPDGYKYEVILVD